jgi:hypothetical protein
MILSRRMIRSAVVGVGLIALPGSIANACNANATDYYDGVTWHFTGFGQLAICGGTHPECHDFEARWGACASQHACGCLQAQRKPVDLGGLIARFAASDEEAATTLASLGFTVVHNVERTALQLVSSCGSVIAHVPNTLLVYSSYRYRLDPPRLAGSTLAERRVAETTHRRSDWYRLKRQPSGP